MALTDGIAESLYIIKEKVDKASNLLDSYDSVNAKIILDQVSFGLQVLEEALSQGMINEIHLITEPKEE